MTPPTDLEKLEPIAELCKRIERAAFGMQAQREFHGTPEEFKCLREALRIAERVDFKLTPDQVLIDARDKYREHKENLSALDAREATS